MPERFEKIKYSVDIDDLYSSYTKENKCEYWGWTLYLKKVMLEIVDYLETLSPESEEQMFTEGKFDSNQTRFEKLSNRLEIGAKAKSIVCGYTMLKFMRMIIDHDPYIFSSCLEEFDWNVSVTSIGQEDENKDWINDYEKKYLNIKQLVKALGQKGTYMSINPISKRESQTELWDYERLRLEISTYTIIK